MRSEARTAGRDLLTRLVRTRTLLTASAFFLAGCIAGYVLSLPALPCAVAGALCLIAALLTWSKKRALAVALIVLMMLPLGALRFQISWQRTEPLPEAKGAALSGRVCEAPVWNAEDARTICVLENVTVDGTPVRAKLRLYLRGEEEDEAALRAVALGDRIECKAHIWQARRATNPGQFDFSNYLRVRGLCGYATAVIADTAISAGNGRWYDFPEYIRSALSARIERLFPENSALAKAFLLGDRSALSEDTRAAYASAGVAHLLAISGMHISILAGALNLLLSRFLNRKQAFGITTALLFLYSLLIGFPASLMRALIMFVVANLAPLFGRYSDGMTRLGAALLVYLVIRPEAILDSGFVLSYGALAGILLLSEPITALFRTEKLLKHRRVRGLRNHLRWTLPKYLVGTLIMTFSAQLAILPAVIAYFGTQPLFSFLGNMVLAPLAMLFYVFSIVAALCGVPLICSASDACFGLLTRLTRFFASMPLSSLRIAAFPAWLIVLCAVICIASSGLSRLKLSIRRFLPLLLIVAALASELCSKLEATGTDLLFLDAEQADCCVIRTEGNVYLVDAGDAYSPAADFLAAKNYALKGVFLSHLHADHALGLGEVLDVTVPEVIYIAPGAFDIDVDEGVAEVIKDAGARGAKIVTLEHDEVVELSASAQMRLLSHEAGFSPATANNSSMVLEFSCGDFRALFPGDADCAVVGGCAVDADVLKVSHHGANDALSEELLMRVSPSACVISVGYNYYGHPTEKTLGLLASSGAEVFRTDENGMIRCVPLDSGGARITTYGGGL